MNPTSPNQASAAVTKGAGVNKGAGAGGVELPSEAETLSSDVVAAMVSLRAEVPEALLVSMRGFIDAHPNWDQYRLFQAALAGFLVQNGVQSREVTRCYLANMFRR